MKKILIYTLAYTMMISQLVQYANATTSHADMVQQTSSIRNNDPQPVIIPLKTVTYTLKQISGRPVITLRTSDGIDGVDFDTRSDQLVTHAVLHVRYNYSPSLIPEQSHIRLTLNDEMIGLLPVTKEDAGHTVSKDIEIDPKLFTDFNHLKFEFIGHYTLTCEDPNHTSLWADISGNSSLELTVQPLALKSDLGILPMPFFDRHDSHMLKLPFIFAASPSLPTLNSAGIVSSWFGTLAAWRGARFPTYLDELPKGHAVVFATNAERPAFLANHPTVSGPTLEIMTNPADGYSKLLLVLGRDAADLRNAALTLSLGDAVLSGSTATVHDVKLDGPRKPYDAPNWVRLDRPMKFGELIDSRANLQVSGHQPPPVLINMRVPPDLFTWRTRGVPVHFNYRYTPPIREGENRLTLSINNQLVQAFNLRSSGQGGDSQRLRLPLMDDILLNEQREIFLPAFTLGAQDQLKFEFSFNQEKKADCLDTPIDNVRSSLDADSTVDFSGFPHYAEMPNLNYYVTSGYPFTKYADLSQTVVVMPKKPAAQDIETMLTELGDMGISTGYPATRVTLTGPSDTSAFKDKDILIIGSSPTQSLLETWQKYLPATISGDSRQIKQPKRSVSFLYDWLGFGTMPNPKVASDQSVNSQGAIAAVMGFESPVSAKRSVVAITANSPQEMGTALNVLNNPAMSQYIQGSVAFIHPHEADSFLVGPTYYVGELPVWTRIWYPMSKHPFLLALMAVIAVLIFAFALWRMLRRATAKRIGDN
jgi:hypothetical protein